MKPIKRALALLLVAAMVMSFGITTAFAEPEPGEYEGKTVILHSNDVHGAIEYYAKIAALRDEYKAKGAEVILADAGDYSQGTPYVSTSKGASAIDMMNAVGYDVATLGNHEFDYGWAQLKANMANANFKVLCADVFENGETIFDGHTIIEKGGVKIGFFGLETPEAQTKANPALIQGLTFLAEDDMYKCAQDEVDALKGEADIIIALSHLGVDGESAPNRSYDLYSNVSGIDMIIDGHSHTVMEKGDNDEPIQSTGTALENIGVIVIDNKSKTIENNYLVPVHHTEKVGNDDVLVIDYEPSDENVAAAAKVIIDRINAEYGEKFAESLVELNGDKAPNGNRDSETNLGDLITDAMLWAATKEKGSIKVDKDHVVAITNGGGIRAWIHKGDITKKDVNTVLPFGNTVALVYVTGAELLEALEASTYCTPTSVGGFPQIAGMSITVKTYETYDANDEKYPGSTYYGPKSINRVSINNINGKQFDPEDTYAVVTNNFCAAGGDTYYAFAAATEQFDTGIPLDEALMQYITEVLEGKVGAEYAAPQDRITLVQSKNELSGKVVILHSNDVHGAIDGYKYMAGLRDFYKSLGAEVILVDAGDYSQGTPYVSTSKGASAIDMMNAVGYDVATLGNHEFDYGWAQLKANMANADFKALCADVFENGNTIFDAHTIIEKGGVKIGFFGLETPEAQTKANPALIQGLTFLAKDEMYACAQDEVDALKGEADIIIALSHLGVDAESEPNRSYDLWGNTEGIDMIIDGHSHTVMTEGKNGESIQSTGTAFDNIGVIVIDSTTKTIEDHYLFNAENAPIDAEVEAAAKVIIDRVDAEYGEKFAESKVELNGDKAPNGNRDSETNLGDLITDAMLWAATKEDGSIKVPAENVVAITNGGGIRAWIHKGDITKKDVNTVLPFGNTVALVYVTGAELLEALEASTYSTPGAVGGFPQVSGIEFTIKSGVSYDEGDLYPASTYHQPKSIKRVSIDNINGKQFDPEDTYAVVTNNVCAAGGDTYYAFAAATEQFDTGIPLDEALMQYITEVLEGVVGEQYAKPQGRITVFPFTDVAESDWYFDDTLEAFKNGIMAAGIGGGLFAPKNEMNRAMMVTVLYNIAGEPEIQQGWTEDFSDVNEGDWFYEAVLWAYNTHIVSGMGDGTFAPSAPLNRAQAAVMLDNYDHKYNGKQAADLSGVSLSFTDADDIPSWAADSIKYCVSVNYVHGNDDGTYLPKKTLIRAECVVMAVNLYNAIISDN